MALAAPALPEQGLRQERASEDSPRHLVWADISKGIGIYLVVLGHCNVGRRMHLIIYLFHMPLFFFLSGYLHRIRTGYADFARKKAIHLLVPYISFLVFLYPIDIWRALKHHQSIPSELFAAIWGGYKLQHFLGIFWFLPCLFLTQQAMNFLLSKFKLGTVSALVALCATLAYLNSYIVPSFQLPLDAQIVLGSVPFFFLGYLTSKKTENRTYLPFVCVAGALTGLALCLRYKPINYDMASTYYGVPIASFLIALCCIGLVIYGSRILANLPPVARVLSSLGSASLGIMFLHRALMTLSFITKPAIKHGYLASFALTAASLGLSLTLRKISLTRGLFFGSETDFYKVFSPRKIGTL
jgi:fucose 4-O-acetylase-like acetyltransferase